jgi:hypothetical protein
MLYGEATQGRLVIPGMSPGAAKTLLWENGDVWHSYGDRIIGQLAVLTQTMTKIVQDTAQDDALQAKSRAMLQIVSKQGILLPSTLTDTVVSFLSSELYCVGVRFECSWNPQEVPEEQAAYDQDIFDVISRRHPHIGLRHCWAERATRRFGQRTLANGAHVDEECFLRHVQTRW